MAFDSHWQRDCVVLSKLVNVRVWVWKKRAFPHVFNIVMWFADNLNLVFSIMKLEEAHVGGDLLCGSCLEFEADINVLFSLYHYVFLNYASLSFYLRPDREPSL